MFTLGWRGLSRELRTQLAEKSADTQLAEKSADTDLLETVVTCLQNQLSETKMKLVNAVIDKHRMAAHLCFSQSSNWLVP